MTWVRAMPSPMLVALFLYYGMRNPTDALIKHTDTHLRIRILRLIAAAAEARVEPQLRTRRWVELGLLFCVKVV